MKAHPRANRPGLFGRPVLTVTIVLAALAGMGLGAAALADRDKADRSDPVWVTGDGTRVARPATPPGDTVTFSATGDIIMGNAPGRLPARDGDGFFDAVAPALKSDLVMGNLEQPLTGDTGTSKCGTPPKPKCFAFRAPVSYAAHLKDAGFELLNTANNHANDYGAQGRRNTLGALERAGLLHTGTRDQITVVDLRGVRVAVLGFSPYAGTNDVNDLDAARALVRKAAGRAEIVVVQVHMGAEGADRTHVRPGSEIFFGENRGDPRAFARAVIDAGADVVFGHGPHVLRGMEFHRGRLIAYSLGNFAGGGRTLRRDGNLGIGAILHVELKPDGAWAGGRIVSTYMDDQGLPALDAGAGRSRKLIADLSAADFAGTAARIGADGSIAPPG